MTIPHGRPPRILFVALVDNIGLERVVAGLDSQGAVCALMSPPDFYCTQTRSVTRWFALPRHRGLWLGAIFTRVHLETAVRAFEADLIIPLDDIAAKLLRMLAGSQVITGRLKKLLRTSFGTPEGYTAVCSRAGLMQVATELGIRQPRTAIVPDVDSALLAAAGWGYPVVLKAEHTSGGSGVEIVAGPEELRAAFLSLVGRRNLRNHFRGALRQSIWNLAGMTRMARMPPVLQAMVPGVPAMRSVSTWQGRVLDGVSFVAEKIHPEPTGASTMVRNVDNAEMEEAARLIVAKLGCSGFVSFDFMVDAEGGARLIEMNPRPIGTTHLGQLFGHDPCAALVACLRDDGSAHAPRPRAVAKGTIIALFPKEMERDPSNLERLRAVGIRHDVPHGDPAVVANYLRRLTKIHPNAAAGMADALASVAARVAAPGVVAAVSLGSAVVTGGFA
jgi:hypothetical protein